MSLDGYSFERLSSVSHFQLGQIFRDTLSRGGIFVLKQNKSIPRNACKKCQIRPDMEYDAMDSTARPTRHQAFPSGSNVRLPGFLLETRPTEEIL